MNQSNHAPPIGSIIEGYKIVAVLGQGTFGITYLVRDVSLGLQFALKEYFPRNIANRTQRGDVVAKSSADKPAFARGLKQFLGEGQTLAPLDHPNVVKVIRYFEARGTAYLLMTYYDGQPLHGLLESGGVFDGVEIRALTGPLLDALEYIHGHGVTHRDIKPANIYVTREGHPILLDFGAARVARAQGPEVMAAVGSEGYAALEQTIQDGRLGPWTDIYGLAATLYRLLTGEIPTPADRRWALLSSSGQDPLRSLKSRQELKLDAQYLEAVEQGLRVPIEDRPRNVRAWREEFRKARSVPVKPSEKKARITKKPRPGSSAEENHWLPKVLIGVFGFAIAVIILVLVLGGDIKEDVELPAGGQAKSDPDGPGPKSAVIAEKEAWDQTIRADTAIGYQAYLDRFPQGVNAANARTQLEVLDEESWTKADTDNDRNAYEKYLEAFPDGLHVIEAKSRADVFRQAEEQAKLARLEATRMDNNAWEIAQNTRTTSAIDSYINKFPSGINLQVARTLRAQIDREIKDDQAFAAAVSINRANAYQSYISAFPQGRHVADALAALDALVMRPGKVFSDCSVCPTMVVIPPGSGLQGSARDDPEGRSNEKPPRTVRFAEMFALGVHEVTFSQWDACVVEGGCRNQGQDGGFGRGNKPVIWVSWEDAQVYVSWLSTKTGEIYQLPSESQWEYAARAGQAGQWAGGDAAAICSLGNVAGAETAFQWRHTQCRDPFSIGTANVGSLDPNSFGVYDMIGNVAEWTQDCMNLSYLDAPADGSAWERGMCNSRITRGGSWFSGSNEVRLAARFNLKAGDTNDFTGFRVLRQVRD